MMCLFTISWYEIVSAGWMEKLNGYDNSVALTARSMSVSQNSVVFLEYVSKQPDFSSSVFCVWSPTYVIIQ